MENSTFSSYPNSKTPFPLDHPWPVHYAKEQGTTPFWFEKADYPFWKDVTFRYSNLGWYVFAAYIAALFSLQRYMKNRKPLNKEVRVSLILWNGGLAIFSIWGFVRVCQELVPRLWRSNGYYDTVCNRDDRYETTEFWLLLSILSKFLELGDTFFIVLKKQPVLALQWYHHGLVVVTGWKLYPWGEGLSMYYSAINLGVHSLMYTYFAVRGMGIRVPDPLAKSITILQILQMVINTGNNIYSIVIPHWDGRPCPRHPESILYSLLTYITLWGLFVQFFTKRYSKAYKGKGKVQ